MKPPVLVTGATGQVGLFATAFLLEAGHQVIAVTRNEFGLRETGIDGLGHIGWSAAIQGDLPGTTYALLSCGPVRLARELLAKSNEIDGMEWERVVVVGTTSTLTKQDSRDPGERSVIAEIEAGCSEIRAFCQGHDVPLSVLSPTLIYGCGLDENLSRVYRWIGRFGFVPVASRSQGLRQPLHVADLASTLVNAMICKPPLAMETPLSGGEQIAYFEMIARLFDAAGQKRRLRRVPAPLVPLAAGLSGLVPGTGKLNSEMFRRQAIDMVFDDSAARNLLGHEPRAFNPGPDDFNLPDAISKVRDALK